jgi:hypothetical protein
MPGMDKTGPSGTGPNGRGMGPCGGGIPSRQGAGRGMGRGRGYRQAEPFLSGRMTISLSADEENKILEKQKNLVEKQLTAITQRQQELKGNQEKGLDEPA